MVEQKKIGIVTVLYRSASVLDDFFQTLNTQDYRNIILYVVDNSSPDNSLEVSKALAKESFFETRFIECKENYGVAKGNNLGIVAALEDNCDLILLSNNDIKLRPNTIGELFRGMEETEADLAVPKIYSFDTNKFWFAGGRFRFFHGNVQHIGGDEEDIGQFDDIKEIEYAPTCFMLIKRNVFNDVGLMDENFFVYFDDTDFIYRCLIGHKKLLYIPKSVINHKESSSTGGGQSDFYIYYMNRNTVYFSLKNLPLGEKIIAFSYTIFQFFYKKLFALNRKQLSLVIKAHVDGFKLYQK